MQAARDRRERARIAAQKRAEEERAAAARAAAERAAAERAAAEQAAQQQAAAAKVEPEQAADEPDAEAKTFREPVSEPVQQAALVEKPAVQQAQIDPEPQPEPRPDPQQTPAPQAEPAAAQVRPVAVSALKRKKYVAPKYPRAAQRRGMSGWVDVVFTVDIDGSTTDISIRGSDPGDVFVSAATRAVEGWEFEPVVEDGVAIRKRAAVRMQFALE